MDENEQPSKPVKRWRVGRWLLVLVAALVVLAAWVAWKGPSTALRWAVRTYDPALRLEVRSSFYRDGEWVLQGVVLSLRGSHEPVFEAGELRLGPGPQWSSGRFGSLRLVEPFVRLDPNAIAHFTRGGGSGGSGIQWEIGEVMIERGYVWAENFGESGVDLSAGINGTLTSLGPAQGDQLHELRVDNFYLASHDPAGSLPVMGAGLSQLNFTVAGLQQGRVAGVRVDAGWLIAGEGFERLMEEGEFAPAREPGGALVIESLDLVEMQVRPDGLPGGLPAVSFAGQHGFAGHSLRRGGRRVGRDQTPSGIQ